MISCLLSLLKAQHIYKGHRKPVKLIWPWTYFVICAPAVLFQSSCGFHASQLKFCIPGSSRKSQISNYFHWRRCISAAGGIFNPAFVIPRWRDPSCVFIIHTLTHSSETGPQGHLWNRSHRSVIRFPTVVLCTAACAGRILQFNKSIYLWAPPICYRCVFWKWSADRHCCTCGVFRVRSALHSDGL